MELIKAQNAPDTGVEAPLSYEDYFVNMGPQHPSTHGVLRLVLKLAGETVLGLTPVVGYVHRGVEKMGEAMSVVQFTHLTDRLDYLSAHINNWGWALAVEQALGLEVPARAEHIRVIMAELTRISSHQLWWGVLGMDLGAFTPFLYGFRDRERVNDIFEKTCGARLTMNYIRPGGVTQDVEADFAKDVRAFCDYFEPVIDEYETLVGGNVIFQARTKGIGVLSPELARSLGCTGPTLRASGVPYDVRRTRPYGIYPQLAFEVPVLTAGDSWARYQVRILEMRQSLRIIRQALDTMPEGPVRSKLPAALNVPKGRYLGRAEAARGEIAFFLEGDGTAKPWRLKVRSPSFSNLASLPEIIKGCRVADVVTVLSTLDVVIPCIDR
jgi:NADH-quinone oxidoreductase subunit D/NADH-quinone oxidoreductase subunit C/D